MADRRLGLLLLLYLALAALYGVSNPLFEAPDEPEHYFTVQYIADEWRLPAVTPQTEPWLGQEAAQPPLYYLLGALLIAPVETEGAREAVWPNPLVVLGDASVLANRNAYVHGPWEAWPWQGYALAAHLLRLFSALLGAGTLLFLHGSARLLWPERPGRALLATAMVAFLPQFLFLHSAVSNDPLIIVLASAALYQLLRFWFHGGGRRALLLLSLTVGLAMLTKMAGFVLLAYAAFVVVVAAWRRERATGRVLRAASWLVLPASLLGGWLLWRNWQLYGDPTATNQFVRIFGGHEENTLARVLDESRGLWLSLFAVFGWFNLRAPSWVYWVWNGLVVAGLAGAAWQLWPTRRAARPRWLLVGLLAAWVVLVYAALLSFMLRTPAAQGRLLFPALVPLAAGLAFGLDRPFLRWLAPALGLSTALVCGLVVIPGAYTPPPTIARQELPAGAEEINRDLAPGLTLVAADLQTEIARPGEAVWLALYWRRDGALDEAPEQVVELFGREPAPATVGKLQSYHGRGLYPAPLWPEQRIIADLVGVRLDEEMLAPAAVAIYVGLAGEADRVHAGTLKAVPAEWPEVGPPVAELEPGLAIADVSIEPLAAGPGTSVKVGLTWHVSEPPGRALTTFVHLGQPGEEPLASGDSPPLAGRYPTTLWAAGEVIQDQYTVAIPAGLAPGTYPILLGLYDPADGSRRPLYAGGERQPHDSLVAGHVQVIAGGE